MPTKSSRDGYAWEAQFVRWLRKLGFNARRTGRGPDIALGDVAGIPGWAIELKATKEFNLAADLAQASREAERKGVDNYCVVYKRRNHSADQAYMVLPAYIGVKFLALIGDELELAERVMMDMHQGEGI